MTVSERRPRGDGRRHAVGDGLWRIVAAAPAVLGSSLLTLASVPLGPWAALFPLVWVASAAVLLTRVGERIAVRGAYRFGRPSAVQAVVLQPAWATALRMTGTAAGDVELYVQAARVPNAYAAGGRSVAVTSRAVEDCKSGRLSENQLVAVLVHELGHHASGATRPMLLVSWLAAPWRVARNLLIALASVLAGRQSQRGAMVAVVVGLAVAVTRTLHQGQWMVGGVLVFLGLAVVLCPLADAAISRRAEFVADRFAADHGLALQLAAALGAMDDGQPAASGRLRLLLASHPTSERRIRALLAANTASRV
ncbi:M48 family metalloprotease [Geodermatophilus sp. FMUSA9-8]|uniref:M48 family metalloprotease n=1 Tax=Geodermatophilus sp. FMUSA9-8 TaxID=3120155 RepID=UPI00300ABDC6